MTSSKPNESLLALVERLESAHYFGELRRLDILRVSKAVRELREFVLNGVYPPEEYRRVVSLLARLDDEKGLWM